MEINLRSLKLISESDQLVPCLSDEELEVKRLKRFKRFMTWVEKRGELFPGVPDDVSWFHIIPKLSWKDVHTLSSVSPGWQQALETGEMYDHRVLSHSKETLALHHHSRYNYDLGEYDLPVLALYSARDKYCLELPRMPVSRDRSFSRSSSSRYEYQHISIDHTLFVFWAEVDDQYGYSHLYTFNLVERRWKKCAGTNELRHAHRGVAWNGKIYILGGYGITISGELMDVDDQVSSCEVYDPKIDAWSTLIEPIPLCRSYPQVTIMGDEFVVYGGRYSIDEYESTSVPFFDIYHPLKDEWKLVVPSQVHCWHEVFMARGKLHRIITGQIDVYDMDKDVWSLLHTFEDGPDGLMQQFLVDPYKCIAQIGEEIVITYPTSYSRNCKFLQSKGFGSNKKEISWEMVTCSHHDTIRGEGALVPIQL